MIKSDKPLFSKPVLAGLMIFISLMIVVLNMTAPPAKYPQVDIEYWQTDNQIPITWINQPNWYGSNKLELRVRFSHGREQDNKLGLTDALFSLLMLDTLPLNTRSINQRLANVTSQVSYHVGHRESELAITLNSEAEFLQASMDILIPWFNQPSFKERTFYSWQSQHTPYYLSNKAQLEQALFPQSSSRALDALLDEYSLTLADIQQHYQYLLGVINKITLVGDLADPDIMQAYLAQLTQNARFAPIPSKANLATQTSLQTQTGPRLLESHGALAFNPIESAKEWISLQIWLPYFLSQLKQASQPSYVQLHLESSPQQDWSWWSIQHQEAVLQSNTQERHYPQDTYVAKPILDNAINSLSEDAFEQALSRYQDKLASYVLSPSWWARMASQETLDNEESETLNFIRWNETYHQAIYDLSFNDFNASIRRLVLTSSLQELQQRGP